MEKYFLCYKNFLFFLVGCLTISLSISLSVAKAEENEFPVLHYSSQELRSQQIQNDRMLPAFMIGEGETISENYVNLWNNIPNIDETRDQGSCGNCWAWASTAAAEAEYTKHFRSTERISIQYLNSNFYDGGKYDNYTFACYGGDFADFVNFYNYNGKIMIPWSNTGADYVDGNAGKSCSTGRCSNREKEDISENPYIQLSEIQYKRLVPSNVSQEEFINTIKYELDNGRPVLLGMYMTEPSSFQYFWIGSSGIFDPSQYSKTEWSDYVSGGHAVTIIGYDSSSLDPDEHYWIALNSWGLNKFHPDGTFKLKMNVDYNDYFYYTVNTSKGPVTVSFEIASYYTLSVTFAEEPSQSPTESPSETASETTPEETSTPTETPTETESATPEETSTPTEIPTETESATPAETSTPTESPSATVSETVPAETPTPTESSSESSEEEETEESPIQKPTPIQNMVLQIQMYDIFKSGVENIEVKGEVKVENKSEERVLTSDKNGKVVFNKIPLGSNVDISFKKDGYKFSPVNFQIVADDTIKYLEVTVEADNAYKSCARYKNKLKVKPAYKNLKRKIIKENLKKKTENKIKKLLQQFDDKVESIPSGIFSCSNYRRCIKIDYKKTKGELNSILKTIKAIVKKELKKKYPTTFKKINNSISNTSEEIAKISDYSYQCE